MKAAKTIVVPLVRTAVMRAQDIIHGESSMWALNSISREMMPPTQLCEKNYSCNLYDFLGILLELTSASFSALVKKFPPSKCPVK